MIAEVFRRRLGREVDACAHNETGPEQGTSCSGPGSGAFGSGFTGFKADAVAGLVELNAGRRRLLHGGVYSIAALAAPNWAQAAALPPPGRAQVPGRTGRDEAEAARAMTRVFSDADAAFGGSCAVGAPSAYLACDVAPKLRAAAGPGVRQAMFAAATELAYLCAFMYFDSERQPAAQRYCTVALRLAAENHDPAGYATTLRAMSVQAQHLGHHRHAAGLAETAPDAAPGALAPGTGAFVALRAGRRRRGRDRRHPHGAGPPSPGRGISGTRRRR